MRASLLPQRPLQRVGNACTRQQRNHATTTSISPVASVAAPNQAHRSRQSASLRPSMRQNASISMPPQTGRRNLSSSAATPQPSPSATEQQTQQPQPQEQPKKGEDAGGAGGVEQVKSHYALFPQTLPLGPPPSGPFAIDVRALRREFLTLQASAHPDVVPSGPLRRRAEAVSSRINEAYRTLADPLQRAQHLLWLHTGVDVAAEETGKVEDPELLMLVLETREAIEEAGEEGELEGIRAENEERIRGSEEVLGRAFEGGDWEGARREVVRLRYWVNVRESIRNWERGKPVVLQH